MRPRTHLLALSAALALAVTPLTAYGVICYIATWFKTKISCTGGCSGIYDVCPGTVLCSNVPAGFKYTSPVVTAPYPCNTSSGGVGTCPACTGGIPIVPPATVIIPQQSCTNTCP